MSGRTLRPESVVASAVTLSSSATLAPVVAVRDLKVAYDDHLVLDQVSLSIYPGEMVALLGASGSGKSTLIKSLTGFAPISGGTVEVAGRDVGSLGKREMRKMRADVGHIFQQFNLIPRMSVLTNVLTGALHGAGLYNIVGGFSREDRERAMHYLDRVGIAHKAKEPARSLSGGQQQRIAIARALMQRPKIILADEPVASLDPKLANSVLELLREIAVEEQIPVLVSLHVLPLALAHSDRIVGLRGGKMLVSAITADVDADDLSVLYDDESDGDDIDNAYKTGASAGARQGALL
ncbi:MAG: phosphonate ABC transporter ATP-binding protein [Rhodococcus sp.]|nr:phosphonate ABC transporter ATP-binding protein [Rhodococcus sp. (in: high G+C Gram-positive bacteria)]